MAEELRTASNKVGLEINLSKTKDSLSQYKDWELEVRRRVIPKLASIWSPEQCLAQQTTSLLEAEDDTVLMTESQEDLQMMVNKLCEKCKEYGMALNAKKTKVMLVSKNKCNDQINIYAERDKLEEVKGYKYLGQWITSDGKCIEEVNRRIGRSKGEFWELKELLRKDLNIKVKKKILHTYIFSIVSYGAESWTFSKEIIRRIRTFEGWCYRRVLKISWKDHVTNEMVEEKMGCKRELVTGIGQRKMRFAGHVLRGSSGELANLVLDGTIDGKRDRGRQRKTRSDDVKNWSRTGNLGNAKRKAEDKSLWHSIVVNLRIEDDI
ncbi:putative uncharacterized transposon-derived protein F52C9.6 [Nymphon striatum]|nr:putative uncharacterized transposon-derived protein F52C9.6 [Nymphon striatum]